jgi:uncharacterized protein
VKVEHGRVLVMLGISTTNGFQPFPGFAVYAATKAFVSSFSEAIASELAGSGVGVLATLTGPCSGGHPRVSPLS